MNNQSYSVGNVMLNQEKNVIYEILSISECALAFYRQFIPGLKHHNQVATSKTLYQRHMRLALRCQKEIGSEKFELSSDAKALCQAYYQSRQSIEPVEQFAYTGANKIKNQHLLTHEVDCLKLLKLNASKLKNSRFKHELSSEIAWLQIEMDDCIRAFDLVSDLDFQLV
ncbi:hypothetical protein [Catenovulum adriaticum]|uniref:DUF2383 domain-containing protein n=1 Tax=Catenovulum adriaticum TaxID=2984846 RepID=A0ABY7AJW4_9ALTE|nr:hypothetical protein [Catenovulum sp. TS8]WAJ69838.1 hypothetical protein OLW01_11855 [Catenovulum sp. TS8]